MLERGTLRRAQTDVAYRWFLRYTLSEELPHFSTVSYYFKHRFTEETIETVVTPGNVHDSVAFDDVYDKVTESFSP